MLSVALRAWAGEPLKAGLAEAVVLQCHETEVVQALLASDALKPHLLGKIGPGAILINRAGMSAVKEVLAWMGLTVSDDLVAYWPVATSIRDTVAHLAPTADRRREVARQADWSTRAMAMRSVLEGVARRW